MATPRVNGFNGFNGTTEITILANLITSSVQEIIQEYSLIGHEIPSLQSTEPGPIDAGPHLVSPNLAKAIQTIEAACAQLSFTVANPGHVMTNKALALMEPATLFVVTDAKIADMLIGKPEGVPVEDLAKKSGLDAGKLGRILRMLATKHCFQEVKPDVFANNRLSMQLVSTNPVSSVIGHLSDEVLKGAAFLNDTISDPVSAASLSPNDSSFRRAHGLHLFDFYHSPQHKKENDRFAQAMVGWGQVTGKSMLPKVYDWDQVQKDAIFCDVGGGNGHVSLGLIKEFPQIKVVLQDKAVVVEQGRDYWRTEHPEAVEKERVQFVPIDFLVDKPVSDCDFYYLRHILHDWPTKECSRILDNVHQAMKSSSRLLIHEFVLQQATRSYDSTRPEQAPEPLLANYGMGRIRLYQQDINMMVLLNSQERTLQEFIDLATKSGFKFVKLWDSGEAGLLEFSLA